jgi:dihydroflavonol-4-reductase
VTTLVTGATGFLGRHLVRQLVARAERVRALVRDETDSSELSTLGVEVVRGDARDRLAVRAAAAGCERVFHLAGVVSHRRHDLTLLRSTNVEATRVLFGEVEPGSRVVHVSSVAAIGPVASRDERADEQHEFPAHAFALPYAATKREAELLAQTAACDGLDVVIANPGFLLGPGDVYRVSTWPVAAYTTGRLRFTVAGGLSFVDARDVACGLVELGDRGRTGERTILTSREGNLMWDAFFTLVASVSGIHRAQLRFPLWLAVAAARFAPWLVAPDDVRAAGHWWFFDPAKAEREIGFRTRPLVETIADTIAHDRARRR